MSNEVKATLIIVVGIVLVAFSIATESTLTSIYAVPNPAQAKLSLIDKCIGSNSGNNRDCTQMVLEKYKGE